MASSYSTRPARKPRPAADTPIAGTGAAPGYIRLYRRALLRNELLLNIAATPRPSLACSR